MRAAANKPNIKIVAINDPFIPVDYMEYMYKVGTRQAGNVFDAQRCFNTAAGHSLYEP
jgi:hypothetical protein